MSVIQSTISNQDAPFLPPPSHPYGGRAKVLLTSVFGPYAEDDAYGSRRLNPMELYHNQVTRGQGPFSLRMFHRSWGLMFIQHNLAAPTTLLDFPTLERFIAEIRDNAYDVVGISSIPLNIGKVRAMCELVRRWLPEATIVVGGHIASLPDLDTEIDTDHIVRGEGVRWFRRFLGEDEDRPLQHPEILSGIGAQSMGVSLDSRPGDVAATLIPSVGCPLGCSFCATSAMFGGKGKFVDFFSTGDELFDVMCRLERSMQVRSFFVMDENFLIHRRRALRLLELMEMEGKAWSLYVFSSANVLKTYSIEQLLELGISWVWMGLEGENSEYTKLHGIDTRRVVRELQSHGIHVLGSSIIGMEDHTPENIDAVIDYAVGHETDFHQFMLYTPVAGTPLYEAMAAAGRLKDPNEFHPGDIHGQSIFNFRHPHIRDGQEGELIRRAFARDFEVNGPSVLRIARTTLTGWQRHKWHPNTRIRRRIAWESRELATVYAAAAWGASHYGRLPAGVRSELAALKRDLYREFGLKARLAGMFGGPYVRWRLAREARYLSAGRTYEPPTFCETNVAADDLRAVDERATSKSLPLARV
ncbi:MAG: radical SAM protein [Pirellulales bacterium]